MLVDFSFAHKTVAAIFNIVSADKERSLRAFEKCGFSSHALTQEEDGPLLLEMIVTRNAVNRPPYVDCNFRPGCGSPGPRTLTA